MNFAIPLVVAFAAAFVATPLVVRLSLALHCVDRPSERSVSHRDDMPLLGGLAVAFGFAAGLLATLTFTDLSPSDSTMGLILGGAIMLAVGAWDDRVGLSAWPKVVVEVGAAAVAVSYGFQVTHVTEPISQTTLMLPGWIMWTVSVAWIVGITNAVNLVDGIDGLATGVGAIIAATLTAICFEGGQTTGVVLGLALVGGLLGFLPANFAPARIFLGDTGSLFIGYTLSLLALEGYRQVTLLTFVVPLLALAVPILDTSLSILRRVRRGAPIFSADRLHMHHRLLDVEGSPRSAVLQFYFLTACFCLIAFSFTRIHGYAAGLFLICVGVLTLRLLRNLGVLNADAGEDPGVKSADLTAREKEQ